MAGVMMEKVSPLVIFVFSSLLLKSIYVKYSIMETLSLSGVIAEFTFLVLLVISASMIKSRFSFYILLSINVVYTILSLTTLIYFDYYNTIFTYKSLSEIDQVGEISDSVFALFKKEYIFLFSDFILLVFWPLVQKHFSIKWIYINKKAAGCILASLLAFLSISIFRTYGTINELSKYGSLGMVGYQILEAASDINSAFTSENHINAETLEKNRPATIKGNIQLHSIAKNKNIIIVQLESVQNFLLHLKINGMEVTPNLNKFIGYSYYFPHFYTQVGKGNTSDAEFISNTSIYALGDRPMSSVIEGKNVPGLPRLLKKNGYHTATFHANSVSFWNRSQLYHSLGFNEFFDKRYFGTNDMISYGVSDELMYKKTVEKLAEFKRKDMKFYADVISLSSHFPYNLPESKKKFTINLPKKFDNSFVGSYIQAISYADFAFGQFIKDLKKEGLYDNSIIVVYGDHQGLQTKNQKDSDLVQEIFGRKYDMVLDHLNIPLIIKIPGVENGKTINTVGGLVDIYPTVSNLLGVDLSKEIIFGTDLINAENNLIGIRFYAPTGTYINQVYRFSPGKTNDKGNILTFKDHKSTSETKSSLQKEAKILNYIKISDQFVNSLPKLK